MQTLQISIRASEGLHARPAQLFCALAQRFQAEIKVRNVTANSGFVSAKSILLVLTLGVVQGHEIEIVASGVDEQDAIQSLQKLIVEDFRG